MSIPTDLWKLNIKADLWRIADEDYQRRAWFNRDPDVSSPEEAIYQLLNDDLFDEFIDSQAIALSENQKTLAKSLSRSLRGYLDAMPEHPDPYEIIDNPDWILIRKEALALLERLPL